MTPLRATRLALILWPSWVYGALPLQHRLITSDDLPAACHSVGGTYPTDPKVSLFYDYKTYQSVVPPVSDRHAQSFTCDGQSGTLYYLEYASTSRAQDALLFARPVLEQTQPPPVIREWSTGFVIVSFSNPPPDLLAVLDRKMSDATPTGTSVANTPSSARVTLQPDERSIVPPAVSTGPLSTTVSHLPSAPPPATSLQTTALTPETTVPSQGPPSDLSDRLITNAMKRADCKNTDGNAEIKAFCADLKDFLDGTSIEAMITDPASPRIGPYYTLDTDGSLAGPRYQALIGSGKLRQVAMVPLFTTTGVDDFEVQALVDSRRQHKPWPDNDMSRALAAFTPPTQPTAMASSGKSQILKQRGSHALYVRRSDHDWVYVGAYGQNENDQDQSTLMVGRLY